jgi:membrane protease YdiL (CAAX protease family)
MHKDPSISPAAGKQALLTLALLVPAPTLGVLAGMILWPDTMLGKLLFFASKGWILVLPLYWHIRIDRLPRSWSPPRYGGFGIAAILGLCMSAVIIAIYVTVGKTLIQANNVRAMAANIGLDQRRVYLAGALYWICINSVLEEYVWRWFVVSKCRHILPLSGAVIASSMGFTIHHIVAMQVYFNWLVTLLVGAGIFVGGVIWSWCYVRFKSIWPGYVSHAIVDIAVFGIGYILIFH